MKPKSITYISSLTPLRGIAAIFVVLFHYDVWLMLRGFPRLVNTKYSSIITSSYLWVDFFFILSGFVICHAYGKKLENKTITAVKKYLWARFSRLYPLHVFIMLLFVVQTIVLFWLFPEYAIEKWQWTRTVPDFFIHLFFLQTSGIIDRPVWNVGSWSIAAEWWTYIFAIALIPLLNKSKTHLSIIFTILALLGYVYIAYKNPNFTLDEFYGLGTLRCIFGFTIGMNVYQAYKTLINKETIWRKDWLFYIMVLGALSVLHFNLFNVLVIPFFGGFILCASLNNGLPSRLLNSKPLLFLGDISYSIYLIHLFWIYLWVMWLDLYFIPKNPDSTLSISHKILWLFTLLALIIGSSYLTYKYVEIFAQKKLRQRKK
ncbi:peptidoglycan/LPS O-acetylase OafA/YrhL [Maribacter vaceletii]|uniref:Peptidoglycan/LPS O-acetylase OafA/YrhL n=1 Tax=Maribacter vaceletii TaxID=1206816 RepID=A0A495EBI6_9FLAO|nr:acyltransferase [Maribacter vaceletii]RKR14245.1 peptidoglycan/LPS O-acetylase OafA/YrhL [Maribacter vaceletii]